MGAQLPQTEALEKPQWSGCSGARGEIGHDRHVTNIITVTPARAGLMLAGRLSKAAGSPQGSSKCVLLAHTWCGRVCEVQC